MLHPSYSDLMKIVNEETEGDTPVVNSRYTIVMATAKRAREIIAQQDAEDQEVLKPLSQAVKELSDGMLHIIPEDEPAAEETNAADPAGETTAEDGTEEEVSSEDPVPETASEE